MFEVEAILGDCGALTAAGFSQTRPLSATQLVRVVNFSPRRKSNRAAAATVNDAAEDLLSFRIYRCPSSTFLRLLLNLQICIGGESQSKAGRVSAPKMAGTDEGINLINLG